MDKIIKNSIRLLVGFTLIVLLFFIGDLFNLSDALNLHFRFDWAATLCAMFSAIASVSLGIVAMIQNNKAEKMNKQLARLNEDSLRVSAISNNYSLIHFRHEQIIKDNGKTLKIKLYDTRNIPLRKAIIRSVKLQPLESIFKEETAKKKITLSDTTQTVDFEFTPKNDFIDEEFYYADLSVNFPFQKYNKGMNCRLEFDMDIINTLGIATSYKYFLLTGVSSKDNDSGRIVLCNSYEYNNCLNIAREIDLNK